MGLLRDLVNWLRWFFGETPPSSPPRQPGGGLPAPVTRKVSLIIYNPRLPREGGRRLTEVLGWQDPDRLVERFTADLREISHGYANYIIGERLELDEFPVKLDGFRYTGESYLDAWRRRNGFHQPDAVDYHRILEQCNLISKINTGEIDEVWTISFPYAGFYESRMAGPGAFFCNAPPLENTGHAARRFIIMAFNYERGVGEMLESYGHRAESIMAEVYRRAPAVENLWARFTRSQRRSPGVVTEVGDIHHAPNSRQDYDWGNGTQVLSRCRTWQNFPDLSGEPVLVDCREWGSGDIRAHHRWWFSLLPHVAGQTGGISHNWWEYIVDPNRVI